MKNLDFGTIPICATKGGGGGGGYRHGYEKFKDFLGL